MTTNYDFIASKIDALKEQISSLHGKKNDYVFSALCAKAFFYKNPSLKLSDDDFDEIVVDGSRDGGVDILLSDPSSDDGDIIIGQSKFYENAISQQDVIDAITKMVDFFTDMNTGHFEKTTATVQRRFLYLQSEQTKKSKVHFTFFTSAPRNRIRIDYIKRKVQEHILPDITNYVIDIYFCDDIVEEIKESESRRPSVEHGRVNIDRPDNILRYGDNAVIVNVSALSIKTLYAQHHLDLLARNLRFFTRSKTIDSGINNSIETCPEEFWFRNNGITIVCDDFSIGDKEISLSNFSIVNGGQTTHLLFKSPSIDTNKDLFLPCKIIKAQGDTEDARNGFCLDIAKATNSQKPIKDSDLKSNAPEQLRFSQALRDIGVFYQTKRGEDIPKQFKAWYNNTDMTEIGKLCLCGIFQMPCTSRNSPSTMYEDQYYDIIFSGNQHVIAALCKELLYVDYYFRYIYIKSYDKENSNKPNAEVRITFANNARTICIAFTALAARYHYGNINDSCIEHVERASRDDSAMPFLFDIFKNLGEIDHLFTSELFNNKEKLHKTLKKLFDAIINDGVKTFKSDLRNNRGLVATNYLKEESNYYAIISDNWDDLQERINSIFSELDNE